MRDWKGSTLGERVRFTIKRTGLNDAAFAARAVMPKPTLSRLVNDAHPSAGRRTGDTIAKIAKAGGVNDRWLASGEDQPDAANDAAAQDRYPSKAPTAEAMKGIFDDEAIKAMLTEEHYGSTEDPGPAFWTERVLWWHRERQRLRAAVTDVDVAADEVSREPTLEGRPKLKRGRR